MEDKATETPSWVEVRVTEVLEMDLEEDVAQAAEIEVEKLVPATSRVE